MNTTYRVAVCYDRLLSATVALILALALRPDAVAESNLGKTQQIIFPGETPQGLGALEWSSIRNQYEQQRHATVATANGYQARNPRQQWLTRFDGRGFTTQPDAGGWQWGLELRSYGFPGHEGAVASQPKVSVTGQRVTYDWDDTLQEWFINDARGLEHGFTVRERPATKPEPEHPTTNIQQPTSNGLAAVALGVECSMFDVRCFPNPHPLTLTIAVRGGLRPEVQADGRGVRFVDARGATALTYAGLTVLDADGRVLPARFQAVEEFKHPTTNIQRPTSNEPSAAASTLDVRRSMLDVPNPNPPRAPSPTSSIINHQSSILWWTSAARVTR